MVVQMEVLVLKAVYMKKIELINVSLKRQDH